MNKTKTGVCVEHKPARGLKSRGGVRPLWFGPAILLGSFILVFSLFLWLLRENSYKSQRKELVANAELASESICQRLNGNRDYLLMITKERADGLMNARTFQERASRYVADHPEMICVNWVDANYVITDVAPIAPNRQIVGLRLDLPEPRRASRLAMETRQPVYTRPFVVVQGELAFELWVPVYHDDVFLGLFGGIYSYGRLLHSIVSPHVLETTNVSVVDASGKLLWEFPATGTVDEALVHQVSLTPQESGVSLRFNGYGRGVHERSLLLLEFLCLALVLAMAYAMWGLKYEIEVRKQAEEALNRLNEELEQRVEQRTAELSIAKERAETASQAKSAFLSTMSHELRTPLNAILGYAQILKRQNNLFDRQRQQLEIIRTSGEHLLLLINDILDMGKIEAQKMELEELMLDLPSLLGQVFNITRIKAEEKDLSLHYEAGAGLPEYVRGDERKLRQVLLNLLSNAVKYTRRGKVDLRVSYDNGDAGMFRCEVTDTGIGIAQDKLKTIFEPFAQLADEGQVREGSGLGLAITKRLVTLMGGRIGVESEPGKGSIFWVEVPLPTASAGEIAVEKARETVTGFRGERKRILVVDDNITNASMLVSMLEPLGFEVATAGNGREAVDLAIEQRPDLVLLDLVMPEMDGLEAVKEMRLRRELDETRIIGVSASATKSSRRDGFIAACDDFAAKPIEIDLLLEKIESQLKIVWETALPEAAVAEARAEELALEELILPPPEEMIELYELALRGDMRKILDWAAALEERDDRFSRFAGRLRELAGGYKAKAILALLDSKLHSS